MTDPTRKFTAHVIDRRSGHLRHPNPEQQVKLAGVRSRLGRTHALAYCQGCEWHVRFPKRELAQLEGAAFQHVETAHFDALLEGRACLDPDLVDGGEEWLRARFAAVRAR